MKYGHGVQAYTQTQVSTTTNQKQLIVMAYDGIIRFLIRAKEHMVNQEIEPCHIHLVKARAVIEELAGTLNMEDGGQIAQNLWDLYVYFMKTITEANFRKDPSLIEGILPSIKELREAWATLEIPEDDTQAQAANRRIVEAAEGSHRVSITG